MEEVDVAAPKRQMTREQLKTILETALYIITRYSHMSKKSVAPRLTVEQAINLTVFLKPVFMGALHHFALGDMPAIVFTNNEIEAMTQQTELTRCSALHYLSTSLDTVDDLKKALSLL